MPGLDALVRRAETLDAVSGRLSNAWGILYRSFVRARFIKFSRGGGDWPPLKPATIRRRRKGRGKSKIRGSGGKAILRDTGALFASLQPDVGGLLQSQTIRLGLRVSLGGGRRYKSGPTLAEVAEYHHTGSGRLPKREILALPDQKTRARMASAGKKIITDYMKGR